jgi:hypothetical protein
MTLRPSRAVFWLFLGLIGSMTALGVFVLLVGGIASGFLFPVGIEFCLLMLCWHWLRTMKLSLGPTHVSYESLFKKVAVPTADIRAADFQFGRDGNKPLMRIVLRRASTADEVILNVALFDTKDIERWTAALRRQLQTQPV